MSEFYTRKGDNGTSGILGGCRVQKDHPRLEAIGTLDEANAALGVARATSGQKETKDIILIIQRDLYKLMAEVSATLENASQFREIDGDRVRWLETTIEEIGNHIRMPEEFIVPGDSKVGACIDMARTIVRRAERRVSVLFHLGELENPEILHYLNRLSSLCFILEMWESTNTDQISITLAKDR